MDDLDSTTARSKPNEEELGNVRARNEKLASENRRLKARLAFRQIKRRSVRQHVRRKTKAQARLTTQNRNLQKVAVDLAHPFKRGRNHRYCSPAGGFAMALRRNTSKCSTTCFGVAAGVDLHAKTVTKYELALRASLVAADLNCVRDSLSAIKDHVVSGDSGMMYRFVALQGDATNANCWQKSKLHSTEVVCRYTQQPICSDEAQATEAFDSHFMQSRSRTMNGYLQVVQDGTMGGTLGIYKRQLEEMAFEPAWFPRSSEMLALKHGDETSIAWPLCDSSWPTPALLDGAGAASVAEPVVAEQPALQSPSADQPGHDDLAIQDASLVKPEVPVPVVPRCVDVYLQCSDRGPDEVGCRGLVRRQAQRLSNVLFV